MEILHRDDLPLGGFAGLREHRLARISHRDLEFLGQAGEAGWTIGRRSIAVAMFQG